MGSGIAQVSAHAGFKTILYEVNETVLANAKTSIEKNLNALVEKGKISQSEKEKTFVRIQFTSAVQNCIADIFIEAIIEKPEAKTALFDQLEELNRREVIFASNTSSLSITALAGKMKNPERVIGMHFFNPAPLMKLVEVVNTGLTRPDIIQTICGLVQKMGKTPVVCKDSPGFIVNRVARPFYIESLRLVEGGLTSIEKIDMLLESAGFKMGPFKLMDLIGNDVNYAVSCSVYDQLGHPDRLKPSNIQKEKVDKGELGRKTGRGYYGYS